MDILMAKTKIDYVDYIIAYESGELDHKKTLELFSHLVGNGQAWSLQGHYGRTAKALIDAELLDKDGKINWNKFNELVD
tara:strand:+ start:713 stop:949 length:237 start_codon:yes stop_codon:yes gene_type:complete